MAVTENDLLVGPVVPAATTTVISLDYYFENTAHLEVYKDGSETPLTLGVDYTATLPTAVDATDGFITLSVAADGTDSYAIYLKQPLERSSDLQFRGDLRSPVLNLELNRIWRAIQGINTDVLRTFRFSRNSAIPGPIETLDTASRQSKSIVFSPDGSEVIVGPTVDEIENAAANAASAAASADRIDLGSFDADVAATATARDEAEIAQTGAETAEAAAVVAQGAAETAQGLAETAQSGAEGAEVGAVAAQGAAETARGLAETFAGVDHRVATWADLALISGTIGDIGYVPVSDTGTHTDPIAAGTVDNSGIYEWAATGLGSAQAERITDTGLAGFQAQIDDVVTPQSAIGRPIGSTLVTGSGAGPQTWVFEDPAEATGTVTAVSFWAAATGTVTIRVFDKQGNTFKQSGSDVDLVAGSTGLNTFSTSFRIEAGQHIGFYGSGVVAVNVGLAGDNGGYRSGAGDVTQITSTTVTTTNRFQISHVITEDTPQDRVDVLEVAGPLATAQEVLWRPKALDLIAGTGNSPANTYVYNDPATLAGKVTKIRLYMASAGWVAIRRFTKATNTFTIRGSSFYFYAEAGLNEITDQIPSEFTVAVGDHIGFYAPGLTFDNATGILGDGTGYRSGSSDSRAFTASIVTTNIQFQLSLEVTVEGVDFADQLGNAVAQVQAQDVDGYILAWGLGQSNTRGRSPENSHVVIEDGQGFKFDHSTSLLSNLQDPTGDVASPSGSVFPEMAKQLLKMTNGRIGLIVVNSAVGGTGVTVEWASGGSSWTGAQADLTAAIADALTNSLNIVGACAYIGIGETDALNSTTKAAYKAGFLDLVARVNTETGTTLPIILTQTGVFQSGDTAALQTIREAQDELVRENDQIHMGHSGAKYFQDRALMADEFHYLPPAYAEQGRVAAAVALAKGVGARVSGLD